MLVAIGIHDWQEIPIDIFDARALRAPVFDKVVDDVRGDGGRDPLAAGERIL